MRLAFASGCALFILLSGNAACVLAADRPLDKAQDTATAASPAPVSASNELSAPKPRPTRAVGKLVCTGKTYKISTGTGGGSCLSSASEGECKDGANGASATCKTGCGPTTGKGTCTTE